MAMIKQGIHSSNPLQFLHPGQPWQSLSSSLFPPASVSATRKNFRRLACRNIAFSSEKWEDLGACVRAFNPRVPLEEAVTPPSSWYTNPSFPALEMERVFYRGWQPVGKHVEGNEAMAMSGASQVKTAGPLNDEHIKCQGCFAYSFPGVGGIYFQIKHRTIVSIQNEEPSH